MDQFLVSLIGINVSVFAGVILLQIQSWRAIGRIEGQLNNGLIKRMDQFEKTLKEIKKCIRHT
jgi:hypothetical protein